MARTRRAWTTLLADIRTLLRETTAATSYWSDAQLLNLFNDCMDYRSLQMQLSVEGWFTTSATFNIVAGTASYALTEGTGRPRRVMIRRTSGSDTYDTPIMRDEKWDRAVHNPATGVDYTYTLPTYRLQGENVVLSPTPSIAMTNGLVVEYECLPARLVSGSDKLALAFPDIAESLLIYDTALAAFDMEASQSDAAEAPVGLEKFRSKLEYMFDQYIELRTQGSPVLGTPFNLGD